MNSLNTLIQDSVGRFQTHGRDMQTLAAVFADAAERHERLGDRFLALSAKLAQSANLATADDVAPLIDEFRALCSERAETSRHLAAVLILIARA